MNQGDLGDLGNLDTATLLQHLPRVRFPAEKDQVAATAEKNDAPQELVQKIRNAGPHASMAPTRSYRRCKGARAVSRNPNDAYLSRRWRKHMDQGNLDVSTFQYYLRGVEFPAEKEEVAQAAESNGATQDLVGQIRNAETERFESAEEVMRALQSPPDTADPV